MTKSVSRSHWELKYRTITVRISPINSVRGLSVLGIIAANAVAVGTIAARSTLQQNANSSGRATPSTPTTPSGAATPQRIIVTPSTQAAGSPTVVYRTVTHTPVFTTAEVVQAATAVTVTPTAGEASTTVGQPQYATLQVSHVGYIST